MKKDLSRKHARRMAVLQEQLQHVRNIIKIPRESTESRKSKWMSRKTAYNGEPTALQDWVKQLSEEDIKKLWRIVQEKKG